MSCAACSSTPVTGAKYVFDGGGSVWLVVDQMIIIITTTMWNTGGYVTRTENNIIITYTPIFLITPYSILQDFV